jgi:hypothetical protein
MLKWLLRSRLAKFSRDTGYDTGYMDEILEADTRAFLRLARLRAVSDHRRDVPVDVWYAARIISAMSEDCGPCTQLMITMAERAGVVAPVLSAIVRGDDAGMPPPVRLGVQFGRAALAHDPAADPLRAEVVRAWGPRGLVSLSFALVTARMYPTLKYAMGHGRACRRVMISGAPVVTAARSLAAPSAPTSSRSG